MKEILINVSKETRMVDLNKSVIGNDGENLQDKLIFTFIDEFVNGQARLEYEIKGNKNYVVLDKKNNTYTIPVRNVITKEGQIDMQLVITEGTDEKEIPVFKSNKFYLFCNSSINAVNEAPNGYELWIDQANVKLNEFAKVIDVIKVDGTGNKYLSDDGTYKLVSSGGGTGGTSNYKDLDEKPSINNVELVGNKTLDALGIQPKGNYQDKLVSGTNIKTINNQSILGSGNINIQGGSGSYTLPIASADTLGGIKVGNNLSIDANGVLSANGGGSESSSNNGVVLFESETAVLGDITLSDDISNYKSVKINFGEYYVPANQTQPLKSYKNILELSTQDGEIAMGSLYFVGVNYNSSGFLLFSKIISIVGNQLTTLRALKVTMKASGNELDSSTSNLGIYKVVGYK